MAEYPELDEATCWACLAPIIGEPIRTCNTTVCSAGCRAAAEEAMVPVSHRG